MSDAHNLKQKQIFETLSEHGLESGIVGSMNTIRGNTQGGFFLPDPWAKNVKSILQVLNHYGSCSAITFRNIQVRCHG
jgi:hypothetical protein